MFLLHKHYKIQTMIFEKKIEKIEKDLEKEEFILPSC